MKKFILASLLATLFVTAFSFEGKAQRKQFSLILTEDYWIPGTNCVVQIAIKVTFFWSPTQGVTGLTSTVPIYTVNCGGGVFAKEGAVKELELYDEDAHVSKLEFHKTGDDVIDKMLDDPKFYNWIKSKLNEQTDLQKN
jgi:hypothetical protein